MGMKRQTVSVKVPAAFIAVILTGYTALLGFVLWFMGFCFQYSLYSIFGKDVPWYLDLLGGAMLNGFNLPVAVCCLIARACGVEVPFYGG
jgi:hypothetical protein